MTVHLEILNKEFSEWEQEMTHVSNCGLKALSVPAGLKPPGLTGVSFCWSRPPLRMDHLLLGLRFSHFFAYYFVDGIPSSVSSLRKDKAFYVLHIQKCLHSVLLED